MHIYVYPPASSTATIYLPRLVSTRLQLPTWSWSAKASEPKPFVPELLPSPTAQMLLSGNCWMPPSGGHQWLMSSWRQPPKLGWSCRKSRKNTRFCSPRNSMLPKTGWRGSLWSYLPTVRTCARPAWRSWKRRHSNMCLRLWRRGFRPKLWLRQPRAAFLRFSWCWTCMATLVTRQCQRWRLLFLTGTVGCKVNLQFRPSAERFRTLVLMLQWHGMILQSLGAKCRVQRCQTICCPSAWESWPISSLIWSPRSGAAN